MQAKQCSSDSRRHPIPRIIPGAGLVLLCAAAATTTVWAQDEQLPQAHTILDKYVEVTGGKAAYQKLHNRVIKGTMRIPAEDANLSVTVYQAAPNNQLVIIESQGKGTFKEGTDGKTSWSVTPLGPRIKRGLERDLLIRSAAFHAEVQWRELYRQVECMGVQALDGQTCYIVRVSPPTGKPDVRYYSKESGLLVKEMITLETENGELPIEMLFRDYRKVDGVLFAHRILQKLPFQEREIVFESIRHNVDMPDDRFDFPQEIKELLERPEKKAKEKPGAKSD